MTIREQIAAAVFALVDSGEPAGVVVKRSYSYAVVLQAAKSIIMYIGANEPEPVGGKYQPVLMKHALTLVFECRAKGTPTSRPDQEVDELVSWVIKTLSAKTTTSGLYHIILEGPTLYSVDQSDHAYCIAKVHMIVHYQTRATDPDIRA